MAGHSRRRRRFRCRFRAARNPVHRVRARHPAEDNGGRLRAHDDSGHPVEDTVRAVWEPNGQPAGEDDDLPCPPKDAAQHRRGHPGSHQDTRQPRSQHDTRQPRSDHDTRHPGSHHDTRHRRNTCSRDGTRHPGSQHDTKHRNTCQPALPRRPPRAASGHCGPPASALPESPAATPGATAGGHDDPRPHLTPPRRRTTRPRVSACWAPPQPRGRRPAGPSTAR